MCGIVGALGENAVESVNKGLQRLEYRGYDSAGIASIGDGEISVNTAVGTIDNVDIPSESFAAIGHTRWATHGGVNEQNAHPHTDCESNIAVAHNGIIENFEELKKDLEKRGHEFSSETDTEVIPHLVEEMIEETSSLREACEKTMKRLNGSFAVVLLTSDGKKVAFRQDSPLVLGVGDDSHFVASDVTAFIHQTDRAIFLEDGDIAMVNGNAEFYNSGERVEREVQEIDWDAEEASKDGNPHYMKKEILEQSKTIKRAAFQNKSDLKEAAEMIAEAEDVYLTGCGTASYAAEMGAKYLRSAGINPRMEMAHELEYHADQISEDDLVIAVSQSGETADLLSLLKKEDAPTLGVVNAAGSTLDRNAEKSLKVNAGPEIGVASTKAFTAQLTVLKLLAGEVAGEREERRKSLIETAEKIDETVESNEEKVEYLAKRLSEQEDVYFIGREKGSILAKEAALKFKELSYIHGEAFPGGEFKHGTLALVEEGTPVVMFSNYDKDLILSNGIEAESRGAELIECGSNPLKEAEESIEIPEDPNSEILEIVPFQMLSYRVALKKGNNPDKPRNLAKSVTVK